MFGDRATEGDLRNRPRKRDVVDLARSDVQKEVWRIVCQAQQLPEGGWHEVIGPNIAHREVGPRLVSPHDSRKIPYRQHECERLVRARNSHVIS